MEINWPEFMTIITAVATLVGHAALWVIRKDQQHDYHISKIYVRIAQIERFLSPRGFITRDDDFHPPSNSK